MELDFILYIAFWASACLLALGLVLHHRASFALCHREYWLFLAMPWKALTFLLGASLITLVAPYTGDPTWDYVDGFFMSVLCFSTSPWVVATLYGAFRRQVRWDELYVAVCVWLFSASWSYDIYLVWRDGAYPSTWLANLFASSVIYLSAGLFWNLEYHPGRGMIFAFMRPAWPARAGQFSFWNWVLYALIFALPAVAAVWMFMW